MHGNQVPVAFPNITTAFDDVFTIQTFKFLFFITMRDSRGQTDITQMIKKQLIDTTFSEDERDDVYKLLLQITNTEICLVVREGLDEWVSPDGSNLAEPSMAGFQNDTCTILTTSRPWKLADERIKNSQIDSLFEIEGLSDPNTFSEHILRCIIDQAKDIDETAYQFKSFVKNRGFQSLSSSPMLYTLVICTWVNTIEEGEHFKGSSLCELYTTLLESLCKKANSATGYFNDSNPPPVHCFSSTSYLQPNMEHLDKLAEVAFKLLFSSERESSIVFDDISLSNHFSHYEFTVRKMFALKAGIISHRKDTGRTRISYSFIHKTVQELLAAYHIACNPCVFDIISRYLKCNNNSYLEISQVLIFVCGMNICAANELSALMNQCDVARGDCFPDYHCEFQDIIVAGIREAAANKQHSISLKHSHFIIDEGNMRDLNLIWSTNTSNVQFLVIKMVMLNSLASDETTSHVEFNLSSCYNLKHLQLRGKSICLGDTARSATSTFPVWIVLNSADSGQREDPPPLLPFIESISLQNVTCSSTCLRSLLCTLLTPGHEVRCSLLFCVITSCAEGSDICTKRARISTGLNNAINMRCAVNDSPGLWEALHGLNITILSLTDECGGLNVNHIELFTKSLSSLRHLKTLSISVPDDSPILWEALHGLNIKTLSLKDLKVDNVESFSQSLSSLKLLETLSITMFKDSPFLWEALHGLNIKSLSLRRVNEFVGLTFDHKEYISQSLLSLTQLETLNIVVDDDCLVLWQALYGLKIKRLSLSYSYFAGLTINHVESLSQCLASLTRLETLSITVQEDSVSLWEALHGLQIKSLRLCENNGGLKVNHVESLSHSLSSLTQLETLTIYMYDFIEIQLPQSLKFVNIYCYELNPSELLDLLNTMSACTQTLETRLDFDCSPILSRRRPKMEEYFDIIKNLKNVLVKRFQIYELAHGPHIWSVRGIGVVDEDAHDDDSVDNKAYNYFLRYMTSHVLNRISMRLQIIPASIL